MYTDHGWCGYSIPYVFWAIGIGLEQCDNLQLVWPSRWLFSLNNFACKMYIGQNQCFLVNSLRQCLNRSNCVHTTHQMIEGLGWCCMSLANVACQMYTCHVHAYMLWMLSHTFVKHYLQYTHIPHPCVPTLEEVAGHWPTSFGRFTHATTNACNPWLLLPILYRYL